MSWRPSKPGRFMRTDDRVGLGVPRRRIGWLAALAIVIFTASLVLIISAVNTRAQLSQDEVTQIRSYLAEARQRRDAEKDQTQAQLDTQARALCEVLVSFEDLDDPRDVARIKSAETKLDCPRVLAAASR